MSEIKINELKGFLRTAAEAANLNNDKKLKGDEEISAFIKTADRLVEAGLVDANYKETLGLTLTENAVTQVVTNPNTEYKVKKDEVKLETTKLNRNERKNFKEVLKGANTFAEVREILENKFTGNSYANAKNVAAMFMDDIQAMNINSKDDVKNIVKLIDKKYDNCDDFNKDIARFLADIAEKEQIEKEKNNLNALYNKINEENPGKSYTERIDLLKSKMEDGYKGSYYDKEAYDALILEISKEANNYLDENIRKNYNAEDSKKEVKKALYEAAGDDKFLKKVIKKDKMDNVLQARYNKFNIVKEVLKDTSLEMLDGELSNSVVTKLEDYLELFVKDNGNYDLTSLQTDIAKIVGADLLLNRSKNTEESELKHVKDKLKGLTGFEFSRKEVKDLVKFLGMDYESKDRSLGTIAKNAGLGLISGAVAGGANATRVRQTQSMILNIDNISMGSSILDILGPNASTVTNPDGSLAIKLFQTQAVDLTMVGALAGAAQAALVNALITLAVGEEINFEKSCFSMTYMADLLNKSDDLKDIQEKIAHKYPGLKGSILAALAEKSFDEAKGDPSWKTAYLGKLSEIAGIGSDPNCGELYADKFNANKSTASTTPAISDKEPEKHVYSTFDIEGEAPVYEDVTSIDAKHTTWSKVASQYPCLVEKYGLSDAIRMIKIAQAIKGDYTVETLEKLLERSKRGLNAMRNIEGFDFEIYKEFYNGTVLPDRKKDENGNYIPGTGLKMPDRLAGCDRDASISLEVKAQDVRRGGGKVSVPNGHVADKYQVSAGSDDIILVKFDNGIEENCESSNERQEKIDAFTQKHGKDNVRKTPWEQN